MPSLAHYTAQYDHEHETTLNKLLHVIGIPVIFTGILLLLFLTLAGLRKLAPLPLHVPPLLVERSAFVRHGRSRC